jgi:hypothetical protein
MTRIYGNTCSALLYNRSSIGHVAQNQRKKGSAMAVLGFRTQKWGCSNSGYSAHILDVTSIALAVRQETSFTFTVACLGNEMSVENTRFGVIRADSGSGGRT